VTDNPLPEAETARGERQRIAGRASIVATGTLLSRLLGLVREQVLAALFTRRETDVFFVAFLIPNVLRQILAEGAVQNGVLPVLTQVREQEGEARAQAAFRSLRGFSLVLLAAVTLLCILLAPQLAQLFAGGYREYGEQFERTVMLTRWVAPYIFFMGTAALGVAALNAHRRFVVTSYAPGLLNVAFIVCAFGLGPWFFELGFDPLLTLAAGVLVGGLLQVVAQWPSLHAIGYLGRPRFDLADPAVRAVLRRMAPVLAGFGIYYMDVVVARHLLSEMGVGAQSYFTFAMRLCDFPQGIFVMAIQSATLPALAALAARGEFDELKKTFSHGLRLALFVALPATALVVVLAHPLVVLVFERGHFDATSSLATSSALVAQGAGIWTVAIVRQLVIVFYALGDTRSPVWVSGLDFLVFVAAALLLRGPYGHVGISWAMTLSSISQVALLWLRLKRRYPTTISLRELLGGAEKLLFATVLASLAALAVLQALLRLGQNSEILAAVLGCFAFGVVYVAGCSVMRVEELQGVLGPLRRRFRRRA
jgi:putative peptidoglycan lipid II flippase